MPEKWTVQKVAQQPPIASRSAVSYKKSDEGGGTPVDENTSPPILLSGNHRKTPPKRGDVTVMKLSTILPKGFNLLYGDMHIFITF